MSDELKARLRALVILDEVRSDNQLGKAAAALLEELERKRDDLSEQLRWTADSYEKTIRDIARERDAAWNAAIEAAEQAANEQLCGICHDGDAIAAIRALKRP